MLKLFVHLYTLNSTGAVAVMAVIGILEDLEKDTVRRLNMKGWTSQLERRGGSTRFTKKMRNGDGCIIIILLHI